MKTTEKPLATFTINGASELSYDEIICLRQWTLEVFDELLNHRQAEFSKRFTAKYFNAGKAG